MVIPEARCLCASSYLLYETSGEEAQEATGEGMNRGQGPREHYFHTGSGRPADSAAPSQTQLGPSSAVDIC